MRVALVAEDYYPQLGGVPEHVHHLALELRKAGHQVTIVTARMDSSNPDPDFVRRVGRSLVIYANGGLARITVGWQLTRELEALFRDLRCDIVHVHGGLAPTLGIVAPRAAIRAGIPVIATHHSWFPRSAGYRVFRRPLQRLLDGHAASIAVSSAAVEAMSRYFRTDWEIIPNGVDTATFNPRGRRPARVGPDPKLLFLGRLEPRTGLGTLLDAMPLIVARFPGAELTVAGDGPWRSAYEKRAADLPVRFLGRVLAERPNLYRDADLYLCPTDRASFGVTLLEAMACGAPIIASDLPAFREVAGDNALYVAARDHAAWAGVVTTLLEAPDLRDAASADGRSGALGYSWPRIAERLIGVYRRVTGIAPRRPRSRPLVGRQVTR